MWKQIEARIFPVQMLLLSLALVAIVLGAMLRIVPVDIAGPVMLGGVLGSMLLFFIELVHDILYPRS